MKRQTQKSSETLSISRDKLLALVGQSFGGTSSQPNPDEPHKPGPWDPVIRQVAKEFSGSRPRTRDLIFGPFPEPWRAERNASRAIFGIIAALHPELFDLLGGGFDYASLNPQPLPPRAAFIAAFTETAIERVQLMQEIADTINQTGEENGIIIVSGKISALVDELCGNNFKIKIPLPRPKHDEDDLLSGLELLTAGAVFVQIAAVTQGGLRHEFTNAGSKLIETGIARM